MKQREEQEVLGLLASKYIILRDRIGAACAGCAKTCAAAPKCYTQKSQKNICITVYFMGFVDNKKINIFC